MSSFNCCFLTCIQVSQEGQVVWYSCLLKNFPKFIVIHSKSLAQLIKQNLMFFWNSLAFWWSNRFSNLISGSSASSKSRLNIWKFMVHVLLKPGLENFEHCFTSVWDACNCAVVWAVLDIALGVGMKTELCQSCGHCWVFQICWHIESSTFTATSFRIWNSSAESSPILTIWGPQFLQPLWPRSPHVKWLVP